MQKNVKNSFFLAVLVFYCLTILLVFSSQAEAQGVPPLPAGQGDFRVENYATGIQNANYVNRGYVFRPAREVKVTGMWGGFGPNCTEFQGGIYEVTSSESGTVTAPGWTWGAQVASVTFSDAVALTPEFRAFSSPVTLRDDQFYLIYQGRTEGGSGCHYSTQDLDFENLEIGSAIIAEWFPRMQAQYRTGSSGTFTSTDDVRILVGFRYETTVNSADLTTVNTTAFQLSGTNDVVLSGNLKDSGQDQPDQELTLYFEWATNSSFTGSTLTPAQPFTITGPAIDVPFGVTLTGLTHGTKYYVRAVAINEAGRTNAQALSFTINDMGIGFPVDATASSGGSVTPATRAVQSGQTTTFFAQANSGYIRLDAVDGTCQQGSWSGNTWTTGAITTACTVEIGFVGFPAVTTLPATSIGASSATIGGNVTSTGGDNPHRLLYDGDGQLIHDAGIGGTGEYTYNWTGLEPGETYSYYASVNNVAGTRTGVTLSVSIPGPPTELEIREQPTETQAGQAISPPPLVLAKDAEGSPVPAGHEIRVFLEEGDFTPSSDTTGFTDATGHVQFDNLVIEQAGEGYTMRFEVVPPDPD